MKVFLKTIPIILYPIFAFSEANNNFPHGFNVSILYANYSGVPTSFEKGTSKLDGLIYRNSSNGPMLAFGKTIVFEEINAMTEFDLEYSYASFSDWRISNRKINSFFLGLKIGYLPLSNRPSALYCSVGLGAMTQSEYLDEWDEVIQQTLYPIYYGIGIKLFIINHLYLRGEFRMVVEGSGLGPNTYVVEETVESGDDNTDLGKRILLGLNWYFK